jgi:predicted flap endonuclease-1-like 5' DNA nuclease
MNSCYGGKMNIFTTFILGVLVGWLIEWLIDFVYWRRRFTQMEDKSVAVRLSETDTMRQIQPAIPAASRRDDLKMIKGIGVVIERKLNEAGIHTFEQLGRMSPAEFKQILGNVIERLSDEESLLAQARQLARGKE